MDRDEIWHGGGPRGGEGSWGGFRPGTPTPPGTGCVKGVWGASGASTVRFGRSPFRTPNPYLEGPGPPVLLEPWALTMKVSS